MNKKERDSLKLQFLLNHQISRSHIADKIKVEKTLSEQLQQLASSLLGKDKLLNGIIIFHHHCFAALDIFDWAYSWWILVIVVLMIQSRSHSLVQTKYLIEIFRYTRSMRLELYGGWSVQFKVTIASYQHLIDIRGFTSLCGYT